MKSESQRKRIRSGFIELQRRVNRLRNVVSPDLMADQNTLDKWVEYNIPPILTLIGTLLADTYTYYGATPPKSVNVSKRLDTSND